MESLLTSLKDKRYCFEHLGGICQWDKFYEEVEEMLKKAKDINLPVVSPTSVIRCHTIHSTW